MEATAESSRQEIKAGNATVVLYKSGDYYVLSWRGIGGKRERQSAGADEKAAIKKAKEKAGELHNGILTTSALREPERIAVELLKTKVESQGRNFCATVGELTSLFDIIQDRDSSIARIGQWFKESVSGITPITPKQALPLLAARKRQEKKSERWITDLDRMLAKFANDFDCPLATITAPQISKWLCGLKLENSEPASLRTQKNFKIAISTLFSWAKDFGYLGRSNSEIDGIIKIEAASGKANPYSPEQISTILKNAPEEIVPWAATRAFCGIREAEARRVNWRCFHWESRNLVLDGDITKTAARRIVPLHDNLIALLEPLKKSGDQPLTVLANPVNTFLRTLQKVKIEPLHNGLRDSFISYRLAELGDKARVAEEAGNSARMVDSSYREIKLSDGRLITQDLAKSYFSVGLS